ncbi:MAG: protein kinase domain-containing protein [Planctomycetota bacterium]
MEDEACRSFLDRACEGDAQLRKEVEKLLAHDFHGKEAKGKFKPGMGRDLLAGAIASSSREPGEVGSAPPKSPLPERIGQYRILEKIGEGGMGTVYLAEQDHPLRRVALKVIRPDLFSPSLLKRFQFEAEVLGRLQHPGIAQILEAGQVDTGGGRLPYFAMEYVEGIGLRSYAKKHDLGIRSRLELVARICDAAHHAHLKGIVHRDLKPDNVLVVDVSTTTTSNGVREFARLGQPKVLDFGVARATDSDVQMTTIQTDIGKLVGTITYMSPEQVEGDSSLLDARSDIYALGVLLYELLSGRLPFDLRNKPVPEAARIIREEEPTRLGSIRTVFRGDIDTIVCKALEKDRERRYASAAELAADIRRYLANEPIIAHPPSTFYQLRKFAKRNKGMVAGLVLAFLILVVGFISSLTFAVRATRGESEARRAEYRHSLTAADAVGDTDPHRALNHLEAIPSEFRGWEWRHLWARLTPHLTEYRADEQSASRHRHRQDNFYFHLRVTARRADGSLMAARIGKGKIELFDPVSGDVVSQFDTAGEDVVPILSTDGSHLAGVSVTGEKLIVWKVKPKVRLFEIPLVSASVGDVCFSPDSSLLVLTSKENTQLIELPTGRCRFRTAPYPTNSGQAVFSRDGSRFALHCYNWGDSGCGGDDYYLCIYNTSGDCLAHRRMGGGNCAMAFSPDGKRLAIGQEQRTIRLLDAATLEDLEEFRRHTGLVSALDFSESGESITSASADGTICIWDLAHGGRPRIFTSLPSDLGATSLTYTPDGERLIAGNYQGICSWDMNRNACSVLKGHSSYVYHVVFSPDGSLLASAGYDNRVCIWDGLTNELFSVLPVKDSRIVLFFTTNGNRLIGGAILDPATGIQLTESRIPMDGPLFDAITEKYSVKDVIECPYPPRRLRFAAGGTKLCAPGEPFALSWDRSLMADGRKKDVLQIRDRITGKTVKQINRPDNMSVAFSPDTTKIVTGHENGLVKVWDLESGQELAILKGHTSKVYSVNYNPDGDRIASGSNDNNIIIWDAETYEQVAVLRGHTSYVHSVCFSPDGTKLASGSGDGTVRIWDSVPPAERWAQIQRDKALQREAAPLVDRLLAELGDSLDVADRLRADENLSDDFRRAALRVLLERSVAAREEEPR